MLVEWKGSLYSIKKRFIDLIDTAISGSPHFGHTSPEWFALPRNLTTQLPLATVRIGPMTVEDEVYGRVLTSDTSVDYGEYDRFSFIVHCFASACKGDSCESSLDYVQDFADDIVKYLKSHRRDLATDYGVYDIVDVDQRESMIERVPANVRRIIIEGGLEAVKYDTEHTI